MGNKIIYRLSPCGIHLARGFAANAVERTKSQKRTVRCRRSGPERSGVGACSVSAAGRRAASLRWEGPATSSPCPRPKAEQCYQLFDLLGAEWAGFARQIACAQGKSFTLTEAKARTVE